MTTRFWLVRHGEPSDEIRGRCYGSLDVGLSENGRTQMERVARHLREEPLAAIYSSPRSRARESGSIIASLQNCECRESGDLTEINFGDFEGLAYEEIAARYPEPYRQWMTAPTEVQFPNGECFTAMRARVLRGFEEIQRRHEGQTVAIVTHGGVIRVLIAWTLQMPDQALFRLAQHYAAMNLIVWTGDVPAILSMNLAATNL